MAETSVRDALEELIRRSGEGYAAISRLLGRNPAYIQQFIKRGVPRHLSERDRRRIAEHFGVPETVLGAPSPLPNSPEGEPDAVAIPVLADDPSNGKQVFRLDPALLKRIVPDCPTGLAAHVVRGDAMAPTLTDGDCVLVNMSDRLAPRDGLHLIESDGGAVVKRLAVHPVTRRLAILSDNAAYPSHPDCPAGSVRILGRVIWMGRRLP